MNNELPLITISEPSELDLSALDALREFYRDGVTIAAQDEEYPESL
jgi:hypothetical protein